VIVGAVLTQNTNWNNVKKALDNLRNHGILNHNGLLETPIEEIAQLIMSSGYYNQKALRLKLVVEWLDNVTGGDIDNLKEYSTGDLREGLLSIKGIGPETADDILLYALERPVFVIDTYTYRIAVRHGWVPPETSYEELASVFTANLEKDIELYKNCHAAIVEVGKTYCKKRKPLCDDCPGRDALPDSGPLD